MANLKRAEEGDRLSSGRRWFSTAIWPLPSSRRRAEIFELMQKAVALRNELIAKVSNPTEPHNKSLVRKYYAALRADIVRSFEALFEELSKINEARKIGGVPFFGKFCGRRQATVSSVRIPADPSALRRGVPLAIEGRIFVYRRPRHRVG